MTEIVYASFYTRDQYQQIANQYLLASGARLGLQIDSEEKEPVGDYMAGVGLKPSFIKAKLEEHSGKSVVWLDADVILHSDPTEYFASLASECDMAIYTDGVGHLLDSAVVLFSNTPACKKLVDTWCEIQEKVRAEDEYTLTEAVKTHENKNLRMFLLPLRYCFFARGAYQLPTGESPIIETLRLGGCL